MVIGNGFFSDTLSDAIKEMQRISQCEVVQCAFPTIGNIMYYISYKGDIFGMQTIGGKRLTRNRKTTKNKVGIEVHKSVPDAASKEWQMAESLMADGKTLAYRHALMCCIDPSDDIKVDSTLKALAKDPTVSERIIERLKPEANN